MFKYTVLGSFVTRHNFDVTVLVIAVCFLFYRTWCGYSFVKIDVCDICTVLCFGRCCDI